MHDNMGELKTTHTIMTMTISTAKKSVNISQSNELTEAAYYLPLQAKRVLWLCLIQCYPLKDDPDSVSPVFTVLVADYQKYFKVSVDTASSDVKKGVTALAESSVVFYPKDGEFDEIKRPWLAEAGLKKGRGKWQIEFNYKVMPYLMGLTTYGNYGIEDTADFVTYIPRTDEHFAASLAVVPLQLMGYYVAVAKGLDVDKPRNLAKSVTVE